MIHSMGDSHGRATFEGLDGVAVHHLGPITMGRAGRPGDDLLLTAVEDLDLGPDDALVLCFGEIDVRCRVWPHAQQRPVLDVLRERVEPYLTRVAGLQVGGARVAVMSVVPASPRERAYNPQTEFAVAGSDEERAAYTAAINELLASGCAARGLLYLDVYSVFADEHGMLPEAQSDGNVHVRNLELVASVLRAAGLR